MKTLIIASILGTIVASSNATFLFGSGGWLSGSQGSEPQEHLHHHHHHHEVVHKSLGGGGEHHPQAIVRLVHRPVEVQPQHVEFYKVIRENVPQHHEVEAHQVPYGIEEGHGPAPPHVITKVVHPIVHKNFIHNQHEHHYHQASAPAHHHGWD